jgi:hypothetical protein
MDRILSFKWTQAKRLFLLKKKEINNNKSTEENLLYQLLMIFSKRIQDESITVASHNYLAR